MSCSSVRASTVVRAAFVGAALVAASVVSACSSSSSAAPAGLNTQQAAQLNSQQYSDADRAAASALTPQTGSFLDGKTTVTRLASTTPANGDVNPYSIWAVTRTVGTLTAGDVLVDNFNNKSNDQGTGTTIVNVHADGSTSVFASVPSTLAGCTGGVGLTTAMVQLKSGWIIVGSAPTTDGKMDTSNRGCLIELTPTGHVGGVIADTALNGPWDAVVDDNGTAPVLFVTTTFAGVGGTTTATVNQGTVVRLDLTEGSTATAPKVTAEHTIVTGLPERQDAAALVKGPTGLALGSNGTLYIADNLGNRVLALANALTDTSGTTRPTVLSSGGQLAGPLGMALAPNGDVLVANAVNGKIVEISPAGRQVGEFYAIQDVGQDPPGNGDLFGIALTADGKGLLFVGDDNNDLQELHA